MVPDIYQPFVPQSSSVPASLDESEEKGSASKKRKLFSQSLDESLSKEQTDHLQPLYSNLPLPLTSQPLYSNLPPQAPPPPGRPDLPRSPGSPGGRPFPGQ